MSIELITLVLFGALFLVMALGLPVAFVLGGVAMVFTYFLWGPQSLFMAAIKPFGVATSTILVALPQFILMANIMERSGVAEDLYTTMHKWFGSLKGGLAIGTVGLGTVFAAMAGGSIAGTVVMGLIALPAMIKRKYDKELSVGAIQASGPLGVIIPPSNMMILYAWIAELPLGRLFMAGVVPGLVMATQYVIYILTRCKLQPHLGPALPPEERVNWRGKIVATKGIILPVFIILGVLGSIFAGIASPSEAASVGVLGAIVSAIIHRRISWKVLSEAGFRTVELTGMILWMVIGASAFSTLYHGVGAGDLVSNLIMGLEMNRWFILLIIMGVLFTLGCVLDPTSIIMITVPILMRVIKQMGFDPVWFAMLFVINMEVSYTTPPFGRNLFTMKAVAPREISMATIIRASLPFIALDVIALFWVMLLPQLALWLPGMMMK